MTSGVAKGQIHPRHLSFNCNQTFFKKVKECIYWPCGIEHELKCNKTHSKLRSTDNLWLLCLLNFLYYIERLGLCVCLGVSDRDSHFEKVGSYIKGPGAAMTRPATTQVWSLTEFYRVSFWLSKIKNLCQISAIFQQHNQGLSINSPPWEQCTFVSWIFTKNKANRKNELMPRPANDQSRAGWIQCITFSAKCGGP